MALDSTKRLILRYVLAHPDAKDAIEGIAKYWITRQNVDDQVDDVVRVVNELSGSGILIERVGLDGRSVYSLNKDMMEEIKEIVE